LREYVIVSKNQSHGEFFCTNLQFKLSGGWKAQHIQINNSIIIESNEKQFDSSAYDRETSPHY
jgi:hypothetical protein